MSTITETLEAALQGGEGVAWINCKHGIMGVPGNGIIQFRWKRRQNKQNNYGAGTKPLNRTRGRKEYEVYFKCYGDFTLALETNAPGGDALNYAPFSMTQQITFGGQLYTIEAKYCEFTESGFDTSEGDMTLEGEHPLICGDIEVRKGV